MKDFRAQIYRLKNTITNMAYIGQTTQTLSYRIAQHKWLSKNDPQTALAKAIAEYGIDAFDIEVIGTVFNKLDGNDFEELCIQECNTLFPNGYNINSKAAGVGMISDETKAKLSAAQMGHKVDIKTRLKISKSKTGTILSKDTKEKISKSLTGRTLSEETRKKLSEAHSGKVFTEEHRAKIGQSRIGSTHTEATKQKMRESYRNRMSL